MAPEAQVEWEARAGRPAGAAAIASAVTGMGGLVYGNATLATTGGDDTDTAFLVHHHQGALVLTAVLEALSVLLLGAALAYLYRAAKHRHPGLQSFALPALFVGALGYAVVLIAQQIAFIDAENRVVSRLQANPLPPAAANDVVKHELTHGAVATTTWVQLALGLVLAVGVVLIAQGARRAGLLSNFLGILGIIVGVLLFVPLFGRPPVIAYFWTIALGFLFIDRWPQGRGPAWRSGEAIPWPTAAELRERQEAEKGGGDGRPSDRAAMRRVEQKARERAARAQAESAARDDAGAAEELEEAGAAGATSPHPRSKKRKRKRRR
ncbi:MAG: DUF4386 family protein [Actinobacteria bacterium]|nr:DUF4386 family protein [Actinomycetota bacterium]